MFSDECSGAGSSKQLWLMKRTGPKPLALNPGLWLCCLGIKVHTDCGKEMKSPGILCECRLHPTMEEQTGVSVELGQTQES